jgi:hypothetical protein
MHLFEHLLRFGTTLHIGLYGHTYGIPGTGKKQKKTKNIYIYIYIAIDKSIKGPYICKSEEIYVWRIHMHIYAMACIQPNRNQQP